jgi:hypothetical protein
MYWAIPILRYLIAGSQTIPASCNRFAAQQCLLSPFWFGGVTLIPRHSVWLTPGARLLCYEAARESTDTKRGTSVSRCDWSRHIRGNAKDKCYLCCWLWMIGPECCRKRTDNSKCFLVYVTPLSAEQRVVSRHEVSLSVDFGRTYIIVHGSWQRNGLNLSALRFPPITCLGRLNKSTVGSVSGHPLTGNANLSLRIISRNSWNVHIKLCLWF